MSDYVTERLDSIDDKLHNIDKTLAVNTAQLAEHMKRSEYNEQAVALLAAQIKPIEQHVNNIKFLGSVIAWVAGSSSVLGAIIWVLYRSADSVLK